MIRIITLSFAAAIVTSAAYADTPLEHRAYIVARDSQDVTVIDLDELFLRELHAVALALQVHT